MFAKVGNTRSVKEKLETVAKTTSRREELEPAAQRWIRCRGGWQTFRDAVGLHGQRYADEVLAARGRR